MPATTLPAAENGEGKMIGPPLDPVPINCTDTKSPPPQKMADVRRSANVLHVTDVMEMDNKQLNVPIKSAFGYIEPIIRHYSVQHCVSTFMHFS